MSKAGKKKTRKGKKGKKKDGDGLELSLEDKFRKTNHEVDILKQQLAERQEYAQRYKLRELSVKHDLEASKCSLVEEKLQSKDLTHNLTRQYKTLQIQTETRIQMLEATVQRLTDELTSTKHELLSVTKERDLLKTEKDSEVAALNNKVEQIQKSYEIIIGESLDGLTAQVELNRAKWEGESYGIELAMQNLVQDFGNPVIHTHT